MSTPSAYAVTEKGSADLAYTQATSPGLEEQLTKLVAEQKFPEILSLIQAHHVIGRDMRRRIRRATMEAVRVDKSSLAIDIVIKAFSGDRRRKELARLIAYIDKKRPPKTPSASSSHLPRREERIGKTKESPADQTAHYIKLSHAASARGDWGEAEKWILKIQRENTLLPAIQMLIYSLEQHGQFDRAFNLCRHLPQTECEKNEARVRICVNRAHKGYKEEAQNKAAEILSEPHREETLAKIETG